jgi:hypothetical protein
MADCDLCRIILHWCGGRVGQDGRAGCYRGYGRCTGYWVYNGVVTRVWNIEDRRALGLCLMKVSERAKNST